MLDRDRLTSVLRDEQDRFVRDHPRSQELAEQASHSLLAGVPDAVDDAVGRRLPGVRRPGRGRAVRRRRRPRVRRPLPGRHRGHDRARPPGGGRGARAARPARHDHDAAQQRRRLGGRGARPALRAPAVAVRDDRHRRQPVRAALRAHDHRPAQGGGHGLVLPRHGRRDARRARRGPGGAPPGRDGTAGRRRPHHAGGAVQRRRRPRRRARPRRRGLPAHGAGPDQHRHRAARGRATSTPSARSPGATASCWSSTRPTRCAPVRAAPPARGGSTRTCWWWASRSAAACRWRRTG